MTATQKSQRPRATTLASVQTQRPAQQTPVFARLQSLFPATQPHPGLATNATSEKVTAPLSSPKAAVPPRRVLKVRILTWNMHESLPKGDLEELLGKVPLWSPSNSTLSGSFPNLPMEAAHPYHLVVVAGQECPSLSGIPMGLGAGFKLIDKDKDRERDKEKDHNRDKEKGRERDKESDKPRSKHKDKDEPLSARKALDTPYGAPSGWTSMIEDWLCQGNGFGTRAGSPTVADVGFPKPLSPRPPAKEPRKGPYQLLVKERMMGIYLAVYIHRDLRHLVRGTSRSAVAAGLIGGRVGNKGGIGITVNLDGTTLLFLNAHLAAHEGKVNHRISNLAKIKAELSVDDFLASDDPRVMAEDLTDKFDYTFLCGDLNFRLDISRLHADWLLSRKEYTQALAFDQLTTLMHNGQVFVGFKEAPIDFPPTFKYDVLRSLKHAKRRRSKLDRLKHLADRSQRLTEVEEKELEELEKEEAEEEAEAEAEEEGESTASSIWTSAHSRAGTDREMEDDEFFTSPSSQTMATSASKVSVVLAAQKAKAKWLALLRPMPGKFLRRVKHDTVSAKKVNGQQSSVDVTSNGLLAATTERPASLDAGDRTFLKPPPMILGNSTKSSVPSDEDDGDEKGVYDSSNKKRVPSWCDRILWKSTVEPDLEPEEDAQINLTRPRTRMGQFFANAFRPLSARPRRDSVASIATNTASNSYDESQSPSSSSSPESNDNVLDDIAPFSRFVQQPLAARHNMTHMISNEHPLDSPPLNGTTKHADLGLRRSTSASTSSPSSPSSSPPILDRSLHARRSSVPAPPALILPQQHNDLQPYTHPHTQAHVAPTPSRWRFLSFLSHNTAAQSETSLEPPPSAEVQPRKGDVVCLKYHTLDDRGMRRLEGRSDHRPVIGSYAVYL